MRVFKNGLLAGVIAGALMAGSPAAALTVFTEDFDSEFGGKTHLNHSAFAQWDVSGGAVDLKGATHWVKGSGSYVELDGSKLDGGLITTKSSFAFEAGDWITLTFEASGNQQRTSLEADDRLEVGLLLDDETTLNSYRLGGGFGHVELGTQALGKASGASLLAVKSPWQVYSIRFRAAEAGALKIFAGTESSDNYGPMVDNFSLSITSAIPEPSIWVLSILGFGFAGAALRKARPTLA